jgi:hypothetical protein
MVRPCPVCSRGLFVLRVRFRMATCVCSVPGKPLRRWRRLSLDCADLGSVQGWWWEMRHPSCRGNSNPFREAIQCRRRKASGRADVR